MTAFLPGEERKSFQPPTCWGAKSDRVDFRVFKNCFFILKTVRENFSLDTQVTMVLAFAALCNFINEHEGERGALADISPLDISRILSISPLSCTIRLSAEDW